MDDHTKEGFPQKKSLRYPVPFTHQNGIRDNSFIRASPLE
jgi:hypothetical protein